MSRKILIIRRDNIGDLVCTTPLIRALREKLPDAHIAAFVNTYNAPVLEGSPDLNAVYAYTKAKHAGDVLSVMRAYWQRAVLLLRLYREKFDDVIIAESSYSAKLARQAKWLARKRVIGFGAENGNAVNLDVAEPPRSHRPLHEAEFVFRLGRCYGIEGEPPATRVVSQISTRPQHNKIVGLHISARKPSQRWSEANFIELACALHQRFSVHIMLFWAPGSEQDLQHPGDDQKASAIAKALHDIPFTAVPTHTLRELIDGLAACNVVICADGGAMHLAAGLGKPIVCLFGKSDATRWAPWGTRHELLQAVSQEVADISVADVVEAYTRLVQ